MIYHRKTHSTICRQADILQVVMLHEVIVHSIRPKNGGYSCTFQMLDTLALPIQICSVSLHLHNPSPDIFPWIDRSRIWHVPLYIPCINSKCLNIRLSKSQMAAVETLLPVVVAGTTADLLDCSVIMTWPSLVFGGTNGLGLLPYLPQPFRPS